MSVAGAKEAPEGKRRRARDWAWQLVPVLVTAAVLCYVLARVDWSRARDALGHARLWQFAVLTVVMVPLNCAADAFAMLLVFRRFGLRVAFSDLYTVRAVTYPLAVLNYHAGQAGVAGVLYRGGVPLATAGGWMLFVTVVWCGVLAFFASFGAFFDGPARPFIAPLAAVFFPALALYALALLRPPRFLRPSPEAGRVRRFVTVAIAPLLDAGFAGHVHAFAARLPHFLVHLVWNFAALRCFHVEVPVVPAIVYIPAALAIGALPVNFLGIGTGQLGAVFLFERYSVDGYEGVLACAFCFTTAAILGNLVMGTLFLRRGLRLGSLRTAEPKAPPRAPVQYP